MCPGALAAGRAGGPGASVFGVSDPLSWRDGGILSGVQQPIYAALMIHDSNAKEGGSPSRFVSIGSRMRLDTIRICLDWGDDVRAGFRIVRPASQGALETLIRERVGNSCIRQTVPTPLTPSPSHTREIRLHK
jgi:hypothetical protein